MEEDLETSMVDTITTLLMPCIYGSLIKELNPSILLVMMTSLCSLMINWPWILVEFIPLKLQIWISLTRQEDVVTLLFRLFVHQAVQLVAEVIWVVPWVLVLAS
jgi:hypothetical protein